MISGSPMDSEKLISKEVIMNGMCIQFCGEKKLTMADGSSMLVTLTLPWPSHKYLEMVVD
mgnify:FL=1